MVPTHILVPDTKVKSCVGRQEGTASWFPLLRPSLHFTRQPAWNRQSWPLRNDQMLTNSVKALIFGTQGHQRGWFLVGPCHVLTSSPSLFWFLTLLLSFPYHIWHHAYRSCVPPVTSVNLSRLLQAPSPKRLETRVSACEFGVCDLFHNSKVLNTFFTASAGQRGLHSFSSLCRLNRVVRVFGVLVRSLPAAGMPTS